MFKTRQQFVISLYLEPDDAKPLCIKMSFQFKRMLNVSLSLTTRGNKKKKLECV